MRPRRDLCVEVRRETDGVVYSRILDRAVETAADLTRVDNRQRYVVIDRARGRMLDAETVVNRATYIADLLGVELIEDLTWPCSASRGYGHCQCPKCAAEADKRAKR